MDSSEGLQNRRYPFASILPSLMKFTLELLDFMSVITCIWTVFWLIYLCFLKDILDITMYAVLKLGKRIFWILKITGINDLIRSIFSPEKFVYNTQSSTGDFDIHSDVLESSPARLSVTTCEVNRHREILPTTPSSRCIFINPRKVKLNWNDKQTKEVAYVSPVQQSFFKRKILNWGLKTRRSNSYSPQNYSMPMKDFRRIQETIAKAPSGVRDDKENLILNESPDKSGCCDSIVSFFKQRFYAKGSPPSMRYERF